MARPAGLLAGRSGAGTEFEIVGDGHASEYLVEIARDSHLADRMRDFAVLDPEAGGAAAVIAGDAVNPHAHQLGDIEAAFDIGHQLGRTQLAGFYPYIGRGE